MDAHTLGKLDFDAVRQRVADWARSSLGKERAWALMPVQDQESIVESIARTTEMVDLLASRLEPPLGGLKDVRLAAKRASLGVLLEIEQIRDIRDVADLTGRAYEYWLRLTVDYPRIERLLSDLSDLRPLARQIDESIDDRGQVRNDATPELSNLRRELAVFEARIQKELSRLLRVVEIRSALRYPQPTMSGDHHVLAVAVNHRHKVPGVVHRTSSSGETIYIEPTKVSEISAEMSLIKSAEQREIRRILRRLTESIAAKASDLIRSLDILADLDLIVAKANYSRQLAMSAPRITDDGVIRLLQARHPILEAVFAEQNAALPETDRRSVVPIYVHVGDAFDMLVVTGPNTGGKTVVLKTVGLISLMALSGLHIPADPGSSICLLDNVLADIGDEQSLEQSLSTFSGHMTRIGEVLAACTPKTLVLLDELGAGTDPAEGAALGQAVLDELSAARCRALVTTHLGDLKGYALKHSRVENAAVEFDVETLRPTYRLFIGQTGESCALRVAKRLRVPRRLIARAYHHLRRRRGRGGAEMKQLEAMRMDTERARQSLLDAQQRATAAEVEFKKRHQLLQQEVDVQREIERFRTTLQPGDTVRVLRFDKNGTIQRIDRRREQAAVLVGAVAWELPLADLFPVPK
jgi:DNA mismatch repair protein MutS2